MFVGCQTRYAPSVASCSASRRASRDDEEAGNTSLHLKLHHPPFFLHFSKNVALILKLVTQKRNCSVCFSLFFPACTADSPRFSIPVRRTRRSHLLPAVEERTRRSAPMRSEKDDGEARSIQNLHRNRVDGLRGSRQQPQGSVLQSKRMSLHGLHQH